MTRQALLNKQRQAGAAWICGRQCRVDIELSPARRWRGLAREAGQLVRPLLATNPRRSGPNDIERTCASRLTRKRRPGHVSRLDRKPSDRVGGVRIGEKIERQ